MTEEDRNYLDEAIGLMDEAHSVLSRIRPIPAVIFEVMVRLDAMIETLEAEEEK